MGAIREVSGLGDVTTVSSDGRRCDGERRFAIAGEDNQEL